jgi:plasmid stabilization system protein ParE
MQLCITFNSRALPYRRSEHGGRREMVVQAHRILYRVLPDTGSNDTAGDVEILRVFGPAQDRDEG